VNIAPRIRTQLEKSALAAADWFVASQVRTVKPYWDANEGRYIYDLYLKNQRPVLGLSWTQGRGIFVTLAAWELTGRPEYLASARLAAEYIKTLQIYDCPHDARRQYALREEVPNSEKCYPRDASEAALGLLFLFRATGEADYLRRAVDYAAWFERNAWHPSGWPRGGVNLLDPGKDTGPGAFYQAVHGLLFQNLALATGNDGYLRHLRTLADGVWRYMRADGALIEEGSEGHHAKDGVVQNDDGTMVTLLAAHRVTGERKYLDACLRYGDWILAEQELPLPTISGLPSICCFLIELAQASGKGAYRDWAMDALRKHTLPLQVQAGVHPLATGAFRGEDEPVEYYGPKTARKTDFITTRVTCYAALACFKLLGIMGPYYGAAGWERKIRRPRRG